MKEDYSGTLFDLLEGARHVLSDVKPSLWNERNRVMASENSPWPGPFSYDRTPYLREIVDCASPDHPAKRVAMMKGNQGGASTGVIEAAIGWIISENPGPILFLTGHSELTDEAMNGKIDQMIESCGLRPLIRPNVKKKKNQRTGDTSKSKEFPGGSLTAGSATNHNLLRQRSVRFGFMDDFEAVKSADRKTGNTIRLIEGRFTAYSDIMKLYYISTPELEEGSNIEYVFQKGDQRYYNVPCPCCGDYIVLEWETDLEGTDGREKAGITWRLDENSKLIPGSVGYICQKCGGFFDDSHKYDMNLAGEWRPTCESSEPGYYSYHLSNLYAPAGMYNWEHYVLQYLEANPPGGEPNQGLLQVFNNLVLGKTYKRVSESIKANELQKNIRKYSIGTIPEQLSIADGNGRIVLLTCAADLNGKEDDARLDYEIVAWSESGSSYSVQHGSIGTFIPRENQLKKKIDRERWTYEWNKPKSVWPEFSTILSAKYQVDTGRKVPILMAGIDCGHYSQHAYTFLDKLNSPVRVGLKGRDETKFTKFGVDLAHFRPAKERANLFLVEVNSVKDDLADLISLRWNPSEDSSQPPGFMNFPIPGNLLYTHPTYFSHYEAEHRITETKEGFGIGFRWVKKNSAVQNHFMDCRIYNHALRDILVEKVCRELKITKGTWGDYVAALMGRKK